jgi:predicted DCC family thiol-disulfide oxidoreductase YuxK
MSMNEVIVIYDRQCDLCRNAVAWVSKKLVIDAIDFHTGELSRYSLSKEQCAREVFVICGNERWSGAGAVAFLLKARGNKFGAAVIAGLGPISRFGYRWVASNRSSWPVKILSRLLA